MTERQRDKISEIASIIFTAIDNGNIIRDEDGNLITGLSYNCSNNIGSWSYLYCNSKGKTVSRPVYCCEDKDLDACKKFFLDRGGDKIEVIK